MLQPPAMSSLTTYTTSQLAEAAEVGSQTLRYYERRGLLPEPPRTAGGHRQYGPKHLERLRFIQKVQRLGFQLEEIQELLRVKESPVAASAETVDRFLGRIEEKELALSEMRDSLSKLRDDALSQLIGQPD